MELIRILLVDDEAHVRRGLTMRLGLEPDLHVVGEAADGADAVDMARALQPHVVLMDVRMRSTNGLSAAFDLHEASPGTSVVMLSMHDDDATRLMARVAGAHAFVSKQHADHALVDTIREAAAASSL